MKKFLGVLTVSVLLMACTSAKDENVQVKSQAAPNKLEVLSVADLSGQEKLYTNNWKNLLKATLSKATHKLFPINGLQKLKNKTTCLWQVMLNLIRIV